MINQTSAKINISTNSQAQPQQGIEPFSHDDLHDEQYYYLLACVLNIDLLDYLWICERDSKPLPSFAQAIAYLNGLNSGYVSPISTSLQLTASEVEHG